MKFFFLFLIFSLNAFATDIKDVEMFGYARAGVGTNTYGGEQECFYNQGAGGWGGIGRNELRLGNECSNYLEVGMKFNHSKKAFTQIRLSNSHNGRDATESSSQSTNFVELFAEIKEVNDLPWNFWVGKKFYRDQDVYIDDFYYFGSMNGNGAGVGNINFLNGKLSLAYLNKVSDTRTNLGYVTTMIYDARLKDIKLTENIKENFWIATGHAPGGINSTNGTVYEKSEGYILGTLFDFNLNGKGFNHLAVMYGQGLMNNFNVYGDSLITANNQQSGQKRFRVINHTTFDINEKWAFHASENFENYAINGNTSEQWWGVGIRPIYRVTQNFHMVTEVGTSVVQNSGTRKLTRVTLAPQISVNENIWGRPVLRAFYTHSFWSANNKSFVDDNAPTYANKTSGGAFGFQMESFF